MYQNFIRSKPPFQQFLLLFLFAFFSGIMFVGLSQVIIDAVWNLYSMENPDIMSNYELPEVVQANRLMILFEHVGMFILPALVYARVMSDSPREFLYADRTPHKRYLFSIVFFVVLAFPIINFLAHLNESIDFSAIGIQESFDDMREGNKGITEAFLHHPGVDTLMLNIFMLALIPAIGEELLFRGQFQRLIAQASNNIHIGIWGSAALFSAIHADFLGFVPRMFMGAMLGYLLVWSGSIHLNILAHFVHNTLAIIVNYFVFTGGLEPAADTWGNDDYITVAVSSLLLGGLIYWYWRIGIYGKIKGDYLKRTMTDSMQP